MSMPNSGAQTIAQIIASQWTMLQDYCNTYQLRILSAITSCRSPKLGGHTYQCDHCSMIHYRYHSCRNRHCPQCQNTEKERWIMARNEQLIEVPYYHLVFTLPHDLHALCLAYPRQMYSLLFRSAWQTLNSFGWNRKYLGAQLGATMVLHTWGSNMSYHPHVHCLIPGGGVSVQDKWKNAKGKGKFLFPVKAMSKVFRVKYLSDLKVLLFNLGLDNADTLIAQLSTKPWVVYAKQPFGGPRVVIQYLARYTHKAAITHHRIISWDKESIRFRYTDYRHRNQNKVMTLTTWEFVRRFAMHFLPKGFPRIRHYGILSSSWKKHVFPETRHVKVEWKEVWKAKGLDIDQCPHCKKGRLVFVSLIKPVRGPPTGSIAQKPQPPVL